MLECMSSLGHRYNIHDTDDNSYELVWAGDIKKALSSGIKIKGLDLKGGTIVDKIKEYQKSLLNKYRRMALLGSATRILISSDFSEPDIEAFHIGDGSFVVYLCDNITIFYMDMINNKTNEVIKSIKIIGGCGIEDSLSFYRRSYLESIDLTDFTPFNLKLMDEMFYLCTNLESVKFGKIDTSRVTNMIGLFFKCFKLREVDIENLDTRNVTAFSNMFAYCESFKTLDLSNFVTNKANNMTCMFQHCISLINLDLSNFNTENVLYTSDMFNHCINLKKLNLCSFTGGSLKGMASMFKCCRSLEFLDMSSMYITDNIRNVGLKSVFFNCKLHDGIFVCDDKRLINLLNM